MGEMAMVRSMTLTAASLMMGAILVAGMTRAFVAAPAATHATQTLVATKVPAAALSAAAMTIPSVAHAAEGSVWIPALSAVGAGFAIGLAAIGSGVGQGIAS